MAQEVDGLDVRFAGIAAADLREFRRRIVRSAGLDQLGERTCNVASQANGDATEFLGVLDNTPNSGVACSIGYRGEALIVAGAAVAADAFVTSNGSGKAITAGSGDAVVGRSITAVNAENELLPVLLVEPFKLM